jgi:hypothetical protein
MVADDDRSRRQVCENFVQLDSVHYLLHLSCHLVFCNLHTSLEGTASRWGFSPWAILHGLGHGLHSCAALRAPTFVWVTLSKIGGCPGDNVTHLRLSHPGSCVNGKAGRVTDCFLGWESRALRRERRNGVDEFNRDVTTVVPPSSTISRPAASFSPPIQFFWGCSCSNCFSFFSIIIFSCCLVSLGNRKAICSRMLQGEAPGGWTALP